MGVWPAVVDGAVGVFLHRHLHVVKQSKVEKALAGRVGLQREDDGGGLCLGHVLAEGTGADAGDGARQRERHALPSVEGPVVHSCDGVLHAVVRHLLRNDDGHAGGHEGTVVGLLGGLHRRCACHFVFNVVAAVAGGVIIVNVSPTAALAVSPSVQSTARRKE